MVKYNFSFTDDDVELIFIGLINLGNQNIMLRPDIDAFLEQHEICQILDNREKSNGC